jgi:H+/Cl- antiporter ClcA
VGSAHLPWLGLAFFVVAPVLGGLIYGPLIYRYAREARGHGVPEVMIAVSDNGGRLRPQVSVIKALASALCIGTGGSVGREGPIVQIGLALASGFGQWVKMPESRMRILVACGAGGGIAATFNAPITGVFFGVEIILREFSIDAMFTVMLSAMIADVVAIPFLCSAVANAVTTPPRNQVLPRKRPIPWPATGSLRSRSARIRPRWARRSAMSTGRAAAFQFRSCTNAACEARTPASR